MAPECWRVTLVEEKWGARPGEHVFGAWPLGLVLEHCRAKRVLWAAGALDGSLRLA